MLMYPYLAIGLMKNQNMTGATESLFTKANGGKTKKDTNVPMHTKSKRMELENPGCLGFKDFQIC